MAPGKGLVSNGGRRKLIALYLGTAALAVSVPAFGPGEALAACANCVDGNASGSNSMAWGASSFTDSDYATAVGQGAIAQGEKTTAVGENAWATESSATALGENAKAIESNATAIGQGALATDGATTAIGQGAKATEGLATALGVNSEATGLAATALGMNAKASNTFATATGLQSEASGDSSTANGMEAHATADFASAFGQNARAAAENATALGQGARALHANSTALGQGATTTRADQVMIGTATNTYTLAGLPSAASNAAQNGPLRFVTTDAAGNLGTSSFDLAGLDGRVGSLERGLGEARTEARQGIAAAIAMTTAPMPSAAGRTSWATNMGFFKGETAFGASVAHRLDFFDNPFAVTAGYAYGGGSSHALRVGLAGEF